MLGCGGRQRPSSRCCGDQLCLQHGCHGPAVQEGTGRAVPAPASVRVDPRSAWLRGLPLARALLGCCPAGAGGRRLGWAGQGRASLGQAGRQVRLSGAIALSGRLLGSFLSLSPEYTFVLEDEGGPCGYAAGALCAEDFLQQRDSNWLPATRHKYPRDLGAGTPAPGQVRGHLEQRGAGMGLWRELPHLCLSPAGCPGGSTALLPHRAAGCAPARAAALPLPGAAGHGPPRTGRGGQPQPGHLPAQCAQGQR